MATANYWQGADGDATLVTNWTEGATPAGTDHAIMDGRSQQHINLNQTGGNAGPDAFITTEDYHGNIGAPGAPYDHFNSNACRAIIKGDGNVWLADDNVGLVTITDMRQGGTLTLSGTTLGSLYNMGGKVIVTTGIAASDIVMLYGDLSDVTLEDDGVAATTPLRMGVFAGRLVNKKATHSSNAVNISVYSGATFRQEKEMDSSTTIWVEQGGRFEYPVQTSGQNPIAYINGVLDLSEAEVEIPAFGVIILGPNAEVIGSKLEGGLAYTLDLREDYPVP